MSVENPNLDPKYDLSPDVEQEQDELQIEIEDDTPEEDRGRTPMPQNLKEELEADELEIYDGKVREKLKQLKKTWHDERRLKEQVQREHHEAVNLAKKLLEENNRMKGMMQNGEKEYVGAITHSATLELEAAKKAFKDAYDAGDTDKIAEANQAMQAANIRIVQAKSFRLPPLQSTEVPVQSPPQQETSYTPDEDAVEWQRQNSWFGGDKTKRMTAAALAIHEEITEDGVAAGSKEYYAILNKEIRNTFPKYFESQTQQTRPKPSNVVAPATRSTSSNKVRLKASQVQLAKRLGLSPEQYAREVIALENKNG